MHSKMLLHRDIKPDNFLMGIGKKQHLIYVVDFGLSKFYKDLKTGKHIQYKDGKSLIGTMRYASVNTQLGIEQSRRDDMEALGYVYFYLLRGSLPWQGIKIANKTEKYKAIQELKTSISSETLCKDYPKEFYDYLEYCRSLVFEEQPEYEQLRKQFKELYVKKGYGYDNVYDWNTTKGNTNDHNKSTIKDTKEKIKACHKKEEEKSEIRKVLRDTYSFDKKPKERKSLRSIRLKPSNTFDTV